LYTPLFKRIFFIKNLVCATVVASTIPFASIATLNPIQLFSYGYNVHDFEWMVLATQMVFSASMYIEVLLDILDYDGDKSHGIRTIPVVMGRNNALIFVSNLLFVSNVLSSYLALGFDNHLMLLGTNAAYSYLYYHFFPLLNDPYHPETSKISYKRAITSTTKTLALFLGFALLGTTTGLRHFTFF
jgi:4-hydroxybenzoate polyprenyltransferase